MLDTLINLVNVGDIVANAPIVFNDNINIDNRGLVGMGAGMATTGCLGAGIGQGFSAGKASEAIGRNPEAAPKVRTIMIIGAAIAESGAIYSLLTALILMFVYGPSSNSK
ncbi:ATP synthase F0 subunit C [Mycoplasma sp. (ex Biomphalaria glabrata)]|uniref:ATP synthase F0 subunit C n=1 Tax=Mycoplasma sp. (ex Biomphalaria glabrata) TaxID=1749074 RepID=UPI000A10F475